MNKTQIAKELGIGRTSVRRLLEENLKNNTEQVSLPATMKTVQIGLHLFVENNSKFVKGKKESSGRH